MPVPTGPSPAATVAVRDATRLALQSEAGLAIVLPSPVAVGAADFLAAARRQRVTAVLAQQAAAIGLSAEVSDGLLEVRRWARLRSLRQLRSLTEVARVLDGCGVPAIFFKGPCLAVQTTGDSSARDAGDVDVLVAPEEVAGVVEALERAGWSRQPGQPTDERSFGWHYLRWGGCELALDGRLGRVDLHWRLVPARHALPGFDVLWSRRSEVEVGGAAFATLGLADALDHSCQHAAKDRWLSLRSLVDVHRLLRETALLPPRSGAPVEEATVAVLESTLGLPPGAEGSRASPRRAASAVRAALRAQDEPIRMHRPAGVGTYRAVHYSLASDHGTTNVVRTLAVAVVPPHTFAGNSARTAPVAVALAVPRRIRRVTLRVLGRVESAAPDSRAPGSAPSP
jgi:hypothetical protein